MKDKFLYHNKMGDLSTDEIKLYGKWSSYYTKRVELALKLKGIPYEYIEEDLETKSELFLRYNPVHKKFPILVHNGTPIVESLVILEYIDETWKNSPRLLPEDPYERAKARFWVHFYEQKFVPSFFPVMMLEGEEQEKAIEGVYESLTVLEEGLCEDFPAAKTSPFFNGETFGYLNIVICLSSCSHEAFQEAVGAKSKMLDPKKHPLFMSWVYAVSEHPLVKGIIPPHEKMVEIIKMNREKFKAAT